MQSFNEEGFNCIAERHLNDPGNFSFAEVTEEKISEMVYQVAETNPDAITIYCTNLRGAPLVEKLEKKLNMTVLSSNQALIWETLEKINENKSVTGFGSLFN